MKVEKISQIFLDIFELNEFQGNLKDLSEENYKKLRKNILKNNFCDPFKVWKNKGKYYILDGHQRYRVLKQMREEGEKIPKVPCDLIHCKDAKDAKRKVLAYISQYGKITDEGLYEFLDNDLNLEINELAETIDLPDFDIDKFIKGYYEEEIPKDFNYIPNIQEKTKIKPGDIFEIDGKHRIICGDSEDLETYKILFDNKKADLVFTSPPYNQTNNAPKPYDKPKAKLYLNNDDKKSKEEYFNFIIKVLNNISNFTNDDNPVLFNMAYTANSRDDYGKIIFSERNPFTVKETIIWDKLHGFAIANVGILSRRCEFIFLMSKGKKYYTNQTRKDCWFNYWDISSMGAQQEIHKACFPVELPEKAIKFFGKENGIILDCFLGSGSTLIASEKNNCICYGIELEPLYVDLTLQRYKEIFPNCQIKCINKC